MKKTLVVSLWNDLATTVGQELLDISDKSPVVAIKSLKVGDFQGTSDYPPLLGFTLQFFDTNENNRKGPIFCFSLVRCIPVNLEQEHHFS